MSPLIMARCGSISSEYVAEILLDEVPAVHVRDTHPGIFRMGIPLPFDEILYIRIGVRLEGGMQYILLLQYPHGNWATGLSLLDWNMDGNSGMDCRMDDGIFVSSFVPFQLCQTSEVSFITGKATSYIQLICQSLLKSSDL